MGVNSMNRAIVKKGIGVYASSDIGKRTSNQDFIYYDEFKGIKIGVVCDGMGGLKEGDEASIVAAKIFVKNIINLIKNPKIKFHLKDFRKLAYTKIIDKCHKAIVSITGYMGGSGTTLTGIIVGPKEDVNRYVEIIHIGDSRCYRVVKNKFKKPLKPVILTNDHSITGDMVINNIIKIHQINDYYGSNSLNKFLGDNKSSQADLISLDWIKDDTYIICSDGIWGPLHGDEGLWLPSKLTIDGPYLSKIIKESLDRGSTDNCSVLIICLEN